MLLFLGLISALLLGLYDAARKRALRQSPVLPVLWLACCFSMLPLLPGLIGYSLGTWPQLGLFALRDLPWSVHGLLLVKALMVTASWVFAYAAIRRLPLGIAIAIRAGAPLFVVVGGVLCFAERPGLWQWPGLALACVAYFLLGASSQRHDALRLWRHPGFWLMLAGTALGVLCSLYDKYLVHDLGLGAYEIQTWYVTYLPVVQAPLVLLLWWPKRQQQPFQWHWVIPAIGVLLLIADLVYFYALMLPGAQIGVLETLRRANVLVSLLLSGWLFGEAGLRDKARAVIILLAGLALVALGS